MAKRLSDELNKNTEQQKKLYREQYYANHGVYPPEEKGCLGIIIDIILLPFKIIKWLFKPFKWVLKMLFIIFLKAPFYIFPKFLWRKGLVGKILMGVYFLGWIIFFIVCYFNGR